MLQITVGEAENKVEVSASIGVALSTNCEEEFLKLYADADQKLYKAKENGKNRFWIN